MVSVKFLAFVTTLLEFLIVHLFGQLKLAAVVRLESILKNAEQIQNNRSQHGQQSRQKPVSTTVNPSQRNHSSKLEYGTMKKHLLRRKLAILHNVYMEAHYK